MKYVVSMFILLLIGLSQLCAHMPQGTPHRSAANVFNESKAGDKSIILDSLTVVIQAAPMVPGENCRIEVVENEVEEQESVSSRKYVEISDYFTALLNTQAIECFFNPTKKGTAQCDHLYHIPSHRCYLVFGAFRI